MISLYLFRMQLLTPSVHVCIEATSDSIRSWQEPADFLCIRQESLDSQTSDIIISDVAHLPSLSSCLTA